MKLARAYRSVMTMLGNPARILFGYDLFISFALGAPPRGTHSYASDLARQLRERGFVVFFSEDEAPAGGPLNPTLSRALRRSHALIVVANRETLENPRWVRKEVEHFRKLHPRRPIIPIFVGDVLQDHKFMATVLEWLPYEGKIWVSETVEAIEMGLVPDTSFKRLVTAPISRRSNRLWRVTVGGTLCILAALVLTLFLTNQDLRKAIHKNIAFRLKAESQTTLAGLQSGGPVLGLLKLLVAYRISQQPEIEGDLWKEVIALQAVRKLGDLPEGHLTTSPAGKFIALSSDGKRIFTRGGTSTLHQVDAQTGQQLPFLQKEDQGKAYRMGLGCDAIVSSRNDSLYLWDSHGGKLLREAKSPSEQMITALAFHPNCTYLVSADLTGLFQLWNANTLAPIGQAVKGHMQQFGTDGLVSSVDVASTDGKKVLMASGGSGGVQLWNALPIEPIGGLMPAHEDTGFISLDSILSNVESVAFNRDASLVASGGQDNNAYIWDAKTRKQIRPLRGHTGKVVSVSFNSNGNRIVTCSEDGTLRQWEVSSGKLVGDILKIPAKSAVYSEDGTRIFAAGDNTIWILDSEVNLENGATVKRLNHKVSSLAFSPVDPRIAFASDDGTLGLVDSSSYNTMYETRQTSLAARSVAFNHDGSLIVSAGDDGRIRRWNGLTLQESGFPIKTDHGQVNALALSPDGARIISGGADNKLQLWNTSGGKSRENSLDGHLESIPGIRGVNCVAFSHDGKFIASGGDDGRIVLRDGRTDTPQGVLTTEGMMPVKSLAVSPDDRQIISGSIDGSLRLWDVRLGRQIRNEWSGHAGTVNSVSYSPDGHYIASAGDDGKVLTWEAATGKLIGEPLTENNNGRSKVVVALKSVVFSPNGSLIVAGGEDSVLRFWPAPKTWPDVLCAKLARNLSHKEWREHVSSAIEYIPQCAGLPIPPDEPSGSPVHIDGSEVK